MLLFFDKLIEEIFGWSIKDLFWCIKYGYLSANFAGNVVLIYVTFILDNE